MFVQHLASGPKVLHENGRRAIAIHDASHAGGREASGVLVESRAAASIAQSSSHLPKGTKFFSLCS